MYFQNVIVSKLPSRAAQIFWEFLPQTPSLSLTQTMTPYQFLGPYDIVLPRPESFEVGHFVSTRNNDALRAPPLLAPAPRGHWRFHVYNGLCAKKKFGLDRPLKALRPLEGPGEARDH